jgi:hypothetical protein
VTAETAFGGSTSNGAAATPARSDHTHGTPAAPTAASVGAVPTTGGTFTGNLNVQSSITAKPAGTGVKGIRLVGASTQLHYTVDDLYILGYTTADFGGAGVFNMGLRAAGGQYLFGDTQWFTEPFGAQRHRINSLAAGDVIFNDDGAATNMRVEGDTDANLLFVQGSTDRVGIGTATPGVKLDVTGEQRATAQTASGINSLSTTRLVGRKTTASAPTGSTWAVGDQLVTPDGTQWLCTVAGTPGTWVAATAAVVTLTDAATIATDASLGYRFRCTMTASRALGVPTNPTDGKEVIWMLTASGGAWTPTWATGAGGFVGTAGTSIASGSTGTLKAIYDLPANRWRIQSWVITPAT